MDLAEQWLREYDPDYAVSCKMWRHIKGGIYRPDQIWTRDGNRARIREVSMAPTAIQAIAERGM